MIAQLRDKLATLTASNQRMTKVLEEKTQTIAHLQEKTTTLQKQNMDLQGSNSHPVKECSQCSYLQRENTQLREEVNKLQYRVDHQQQPKLGTDLDISFWLVSHEEVCPTGQILGTGSYGNVSLATFRGQKVACKQLHSTIISPYYNDLLRREISLMSKIRHPNLLLFIAAALDSPSHDPIIITEVLDTELRKAYQDGQLANNRVRLFILRDVAAALNYLHLQHEPIIHRDVSSANVLLQALPDNWWKGKLSDFGSANIVRYASTLAPGNRQYMPPEVLREEKQSTKVDVYSYGKLLCEIFTNQFPDQKAFPSMLQSMAHKWPLMHSIITTCVDHDPDKRPTMSSILEQLNRFTQ